VVTWHDARADDFYRFRSPESSPVSPDAGCRAGKMRRMEKIRMEKMGRKVKKVETRRIEK
jgi:hypothetical protein